MAYSEDSYSGPTRSTRTRGLLGVIVLMAYYEYRLGIGT